MSKKRDKFNNTAKDSFLQSIPNFALSSDSCDIASRLKFNFSYLDESQVKNGFVTLKDLTKEQIEKIWDKLKNFSHSPRHYWEKQYQGSGDHRYSLLAVYKDWPKETDAERPKYIPQDVDWARFRLESDFRLCGFFIPQRLDGIEDPKSKIRFDMNTFYVVFLDPNHRFYKTEK